MNISQINISFSGLTRLDATSPRHLSRQSKRARWTQCVVALLYLGWTSSKSTASAQDHSLPGPSPAPQELDAIVVTEALNQARSEIVPSLGSTVYQVGSGQIQNQAQGDNSTFTQILARAPGVVQDQFGQVHIRGEHANLAYRVDGVLVPEGLDGFGQEFDARFIRSVQLMTGALPAEFGWRTAAISDITTKSGGDIKGGEIGFYGGSFDYNKAHLSFGQSKGKWDYFVTISNYHSDLGIENPVASYRPLHDYTNQLKAFGKIAYLIDDTSRISLILSGSYGDFQLPTVPNQRLLFPIKGKSTVRSSEVNDNQNERNYYAILAYQKSLGDLNFQIAAYSRWSQIRFMPDARGDLEYLGVASKVDNTIFSNGVQLDASYNVGDHHTLRFGGNFRSESVLQAATTSVFHTDDSGNLSGAPFDIVYTQRKQAYLTDVYVQDEWQVANWLTLNYGLRYDYFSIFKREQQLSPRASIVWKLGDSTTIHVGYASYFIPPEPLRVTASNLARFKNTTNAPTTFASGPPRAERSHDYDIGIEQKIVHLSLSFDGFYKQARNALDAGQFGQAIILVPFNYKWDRVIGCELAANYSSDDWNLFGTFSYVNTKANSINSSQYEFPFDEVRFIKGHDIYLDHEGEFTATFGASRTFKTDLGTTTLFSEALYGYGLRAGFANTRKVGSYWTFNVGFSHELPLKGFRFRSAKFRFDIVNLFDAVYLLRDGTGIGVGAPQYGNRRGFYAGLSFDF